MERAFVKGMRRNIEQWHNHVFDRKLIGSEHQGELVAKKRRETEHYRSSAVSITERREHHSVVVNEAGNTANSEIIS